MPARDYTHDAVCNALIKDGWTITDDPLRVPTGRTYVYVDLGVEQWIGAERGTERLAIEIKNLNTQSVVHQLELAAGQYLLYQASLHKLKSDRIVFLAVSRLTYETFFLQEPGLALTEFYPMNIVILNVEKEEIEEWIRNSGIDN